MKNKTKKIVAIICLIFMTISSLPLQTFAAFITDMNSNAKFGVISGSLSSYNHELHYVTYDGKTYVAFCCQRGVTSPDGSEYTYDNEFKVKYKNDLPKYEKIAEMIYFGYTMNHGTGLPTTTQAKKDACATQQYVWEYIHSNIDSSLDKPSRDSWNSSYMSSSIYSSWLSKTEDYYKQYHGNTSFNGDTIKVDLGGTKKVTDTTERLASYQSFSETKNGVTFSHTKGSNDLNISVSNDTTADSVKFKSNDYKLYQLLPNGDAYSNDTMSNYMYFQFTSGSVQNLIFSNYVDPSWFSISVEVEYGNALLVKTNTNGDKLAGCKFELYKDANCTQKVRTGTSDSNGQIKFDRLAPATYYIKEVSVPTGYLLDNSVQKVNVKVNETAEVSFKNNEPTGEITIEKTDKDTGNKNRVDKTSHHGDANLKGTIYTLYASEDITNVAKTIKYFSKNEEIATFTFDEYGKATINITNNTTKAELSVDGVTLKGLPMGTYYSKETAVSEGYMKDETTHTYTIKYKDMNTPVIKTSGVVENVVERAKFEVIKISSITNTTAPIIEGAEFTAILTKYVDFYGSFDEALKHLDQYAEDEYAVFKTGKNGHGVSNLLAYGKYTVNETYCPSDRINPVQEFYVTIDENSDKPIREVVENDTPFQSYLKMVKIDKKTGKKVTFSNTTFSLYKLNEETNEWERISCKLGKESFDQWTTDENAIAYTETKLDSGKYKIDEIVVANGFLQLEEDCIFEINRSNKTLKYDEAYDAYITINIKNDKPTGTIIVDKEVAIRENVDTSLVDISDLSGIKFKLTAKEDIIDYADGSIIYSKGTEIGTYNLDKDGNLKVENLPMGVYELEEVETLKGLVLDTTKHEIKLEQKDTTTKVYTEKLDIKNDTTAVEISKTDITGDKELVGATLSVLDGDKVVDTWVSTEKTHLIEGLETNKEYTLREEIACEGYVKATDIKFVVENTGEVQKVTMIDKVVEMSKVDIAGEEIVGAKIQVLDKDKKIIDEWKSGKEPHKISNLVEGETYTLHEELAVDSYVKATDIEFTVDFEKETQHLEMIDKIVKVVKTDLVTGEEIEGAKLQITDEDGNIIDEWVSTKEAHIVSNLEEDKTYTLTEITCPYGYEQAESITFKVTEDKNDQLIEMKDMPILTDLRIIKIDSSTHEIIKDKFTFGLYTNKECTELIQQVDANAEDGYVDFTDIRYGHYYIKELSSPKDYELSDKVLEVEINDEGVFVDNEKLEQDDNGIYSIEFENTKIETPNTSDNSKLLIWATLLALSLTSITGIGVYQHKKRKMNNK